MIGHDELFTARFKHGKEEGFIIFVEQKRIRGGICAQAMPPEFIRALGPVKRQVKESTEYLLITTELVESKNGDASLREIHVDFMIGIPVELERVVIQ